MRPFRFGLTAGWVASGDAWRTMAQRAESLGYDIVLATDHLSGQLSPVPALAAAAAVTSRLRIGSYVFANDFRHPLLLAREAATLDALSGGRLEFGIGAGWRVSDYSQLGVPYDAAGRRIDRMEEAVRIVARLLAGETVTHAGRHYQLGGHASRRGRSSSLDRHSCSAAAGHACSGSRPARRTSWASSRSSMPPAGRSWARPPRAPWWRRWRWSGPPPATGSRASSSTCSSPWPGWSAAGAGRSRPCMAAGLAGAGGLVRSPYVLHGTRSRLREILERRRERLGISYYSIPQPAMEAMAPLVEDLAGR